MWLGALFQSLALLTESLNYSSDTSYSQGALQPRLNPGWDGS